MKDECVFKIVVKDDGVKVATIMIREPNYPILQFLRDASAKAESIFSGYQDETHTFDVSFTTVETGSPALSWEAAIKQLEALAESRLTCDLNA